METEFDVKDKTRIGWVLQSLMQSHQLIDVSFAGADEASQSIIVDVDVKKGTFYLDEFPTDEANRLAKKKNHFNLRGALEGVLVKAVDLKIKKTQKDDKGLLYAVPIPTDLMYMQRRDSYRVNIGYGMEIPVDITCLQSPESDTDLEPIDRVATLCDISTTGCRLKIPGGKESYSDESGQLWQLAFTFPEDESPITVIIETCHARFVSRTSSWQFGCRYKDVDGEVLGRIGRFVTDMQRMERSRRNGLG